MTSGIYEILNTANGKRYIGSAVDFAARRRLHLHDLLHNKHHSPKLQNAWNKYGAAAFEFRVLQRCPKEQLLFQEQRALHGFSPWYNVCGVAGSMLGFKHSPSSRAKMSAAASERPRREYTAEHRAAISAGLKGGKRSAESRLKMSAARRRKTYRCGPRARLISWAGEALSVRDWAERLQINENTLGGRLRKKWPVGKAFGMPVQKQFSRDAE